MRVLAFADLQATIGHERSFTEPLKSLQYWRVERFFDELERIYKEFQCQALWDLGDTTDDRVAIPVPILDLLCDRLERFPGQWNIKLVGNHEQYLRDTSVNAGKVFRKHFQVVEKVDVFDCGKFHIVCASFHDDFQAIVDFLRNAPQHNSIVLGHFPVVGCQMSTGTSLTGVPKNVLNFAKLGLLGHVHLPQQMDQLHYIGSPFQQHWGEAGEHKRVAVLDLGTQDGIYKLGWQAIANMPIYRQVSFNVWKDAVKADSEDRYKVVLKSLEETEAFYAHPLANRVDEPIYDYAASVKTQGTDAPISNSKEDLMRRYLAENPPSARNIELDDDAMVQMGTEISTPQ